MGGARSWWSVVAGLALAGAGLVPAGGPAVAAAAPVPVVAPSAPVVSEFSDVPVGAPFRLEIEWLASTGITTGWPDGTFHPSAPVERQAMAAFLYRFAGSPAFTPPVTESFSDVPRSHPFFLEIEWLASTGITTGWPDGTFHPSAPVERQAMAAFLYRYAGSPVFAPPVTASFSDVPVGAPFRLEIEWLAQTGITTGWPDGTFQPSANVERQAMAAFLYRYDRVTTLISRATDGTPANDYSYEPSVSADGRWITYYSEASNLVPGDTNGATDVFVTDRTTGVTTLVSTATDGTANGNSYSPSVSADGRWITYESHASNLVAGDTNGQADVFVTDRTTGVTTLISAGTDGPSDGDSYSASVSADGRWITYSSYASNLVAGDTNGQMDVFVTDRTTGVTTRVSAATDGTQANDGSNEPSVSADGRWITYYSDASNLVAGDTNGQMDVFVTDRTTGVTTLISAGTDGPANGDSYYASVSADGRWITYGSYASNLVAGDTNGQADVFVTDRTTGVTTLISAGSDGPANSDSGDASVSADGRWITYFSDASNLVPGDTNQAADVFVSSNPGMP